MKTLAAARLVLLPALLLPGCSGGGGGGGSTKALPESEPNDTAAQAAALALGRPGVGDVGTAGDVDFWSFRLAKGRYVEIELFAARLDQSDWDQAPNVARLTLFDTDGTTKLLEHDYGGFVSQGWDWGAHDLDFPAFQVPDTGTYFVCVTQDDMALPGGGYAVRARYVNLAGARQEEFEASGTDGANNTPNTSQVIVPGVVHGFHVDDGLDYYAITVTEPTLVRLELTTYRDGVHDGDDDYFDPQLTLFDVDGLTFLTTDDDTFFFDSAIEYVVTTPGEYYVLVAEFGGTGDGDYALTYSASSFTASPESEPNDTVATADAFGYGSAVEGAIDTGETDYYRFTGTTGDMVRLQILDGINLQGAPDTVSVDFVESDGTTVIPSGGNLGLRTLTLILTQSGDQYVRVVPLALQTNYGLRLTLFHSAPFETEPNDNFADANLLGTRIAGVIEAPGDIDRFLFTSAADRLVTIVIYASDTAVDSDGFADLSGHGSTLAPLLGIFDGLGAQLASSTSMPAFAFTECVTDGLPTAAVSFVAPDVGPYYVRVQSALGTGSPTDTYVIERR